MTEPNFTKLLEACGMKPVDLEGQPIELGAFTFTPGEVPTYEVKTSEVVAALVNRAVADEHQRCAEIAAREAVSYRDFAASPLVPGTLTTDVLGERERHEAFIRAAMCEKIARLIGEGQ